MKTRWQVNDHLTITGNQTKGIDYAATADFHPRSNEALYGIYQEYGSVAHFWTVVLFVQQEWEVRRTSGLPAYEKGIKATVKSGLGPVALPVSVSLLPEFLGYATAIRNLYDAIPKPGKSGALLSIEEPWEFTVPKHLAVTPKVDILPIPDRELEHISQLLTQKPI